jgi:hypothetical protein
MINTPLPEKRNQFNQWFLNTTAFMYEASFGTIFQFSNLSILELCPLFPQR